MRKPYVPHIDGKTLIGWGVVREAPWHFAGLFPSQDEAQIKADEMGEGYIVRYGERQEESDTFLSGEPPRGASVMAGSIFAPEAARDDRSSRLAVVAASIDERVERGRRHD